jgi:hypothetical protein
MSTADDRLSVIQNIYLDALNNEPNDLAQATTPTLVTFVQANLATARSAYYAAAAAALSGAAPGVEAAYASAQAALAAVKAARTASESIPTLVGKLNSATNAGTSILGAVGKWPPTP